MSEEFTRHIQIVRQQIEALHSHTLSSPTQQQQAADAQVVASWHPICFAKQ